MRKNVFGRQLKRDANQRKALFKSLLSSFVLYERITTTEAKAKSIKGQMEKLVTKALKYQDGPHFDRFLTPPATKKLIADIAPRFQGRPGGYTRLIRLGKRVRDHASMAIMEFVVEGSKVKVRSEKVEKPEKRSVKKQNVVEAEVITQKPTRSTISGQAKATKKTIKTVTQKAEKKG